MIILMQQHVFSISSNFDAMVRVWFARWEQDSYSQSLYQYQDENCVHNSHGRKRRLMITEEERLCVRLFGGPVIAAHPQNSA